MPSMIKTIEELVVTELKRDGYWFVFNTLYNDVRAFKKPIPPSLDTFWLDQKYTDNNARQDFLDFMSENFPIVKLHEVMDFVPTEVMMWPYLGSIAVDLEKGDPAYQALVKIYGDPEEEASDNRHVFWCMPYEVAVEAHRSREAFWDEELDDDN